MMQKRILIIEDDQDIANLIALHLRDLSYQVDITHNGRQGLALALQDTFDVIVLDIMLPELDGIEICRRLRSAEINTLILMLTARSSELDRVLGLELGADDYLTKPFSINELKARIKAMLRRAKLSTAMNDIDDVLEVQDIKIDINKRVVNINQQDVSLTAREFDLLLHFAKHPGRVYSRTQLLDQVWGYSHEGYEHTVNSHINRLRKKIEVDPADAQYIQTVWGVGYKFSEKAS
ncbi:MAG: response regulator transcription factor [Gammaproteobacteria bacterium]